MAGPLTGRVKVRQAARAQHSPPCLCDPHADYLRFTVRPLDARGRQPGNNEISQKIDCEPLVE
jgi:hypothetical protein